MRRIRTRLRGRGPRRRPRPSGRRAWGRGYYGPKGPMRSPPPPPVGSGSMKIHAEAVLFDNDGTLVSSMESVTRCWTRWAEEYGITAEDFAGVELHGRPAVEIVADLLPADVVPEALARI